MIPNRAWVHNRGWEGVTGNEASWEKLYLEASTSGEVLSMAGRNFDKQLRVGV